jgi:hypothetical protein
VGGADREDDVNEYNVSIRWDGERITDGVDKLAPPMRELVAIELAGQMPGLYWVLNGWAPENYQVDITAVTPVPNRYRP